MEANLPTDISGKHFNCFFFFFGGGGVQYSVLINNSASLQCLQTQYICSWQTHTFRFADCKFDSGPTFVLTSSILDASFAD